MAVLLVHASSTLVIMVSGGRTVIAISFQPLLTASPVLHACFPTAIGPAVQLDSLDRASLLAPSYIVQHFICIVSIHYLYPLSIDVMTLQQLRCICEVVNTGFNLSLAARVLHMSQPGISRYIKMLEDELKVALFVRRKGRFDGLTPAGHAVTALARRALSDVQSIAFAAKDYRDGDLGQLVIATNPGHARYALPRVMERFIKLHPRVQVRIRQGNSAQVAVWVLAGDAEIFVATGPSEPNPDLVLFPCQPIHPVILTPPGHTLTSKKRVTLADLCEHPIITYDEEFTFHQQVMRAFHKNGRTPTILLSAFDADIMKMYVRAGLGIAILANSAYDPKADRDLHAIDARHLFTSTTLHLGVRRHTYVTRHLLAFMALFAPHLDMGEVQKVIG